jgi:exonuclease III
MASLNINSLTAHIDEVRIFTHDTNIDILTINETKLYASVNSNEVNLPGYEIIRKDRYINGRHGGGVCIYVRSNLKFKVRNDFMNDKLECLIIEISKPRSRPFLVGTWYRPPNSPRELLNLFENTIDRIDAENSELYFLGDLNCNLTAQISDANTSDLLNILDTYGLTQLISEPTRITPVSQTLIDLCITNYPEKVASSGVLSLGISDHSLV